MRATKPLLLLLIAFSVLAASVGACVRTAGDTDFSELAEVVRTLNQNYIDKDKISDDELNQAAIRGIIEYLDDPYTSYLSPEQYRHWADSLAGADSQIQGIGAQVTVRGGQIMIVGPMPGSPASRAGIRAGDVVLEVDGVSVTGMELLEAVSLIRGPKGTEVTLLISRAGELRPLEITIIRDEIQVTTVSSRLHDEGIGVIQLENFDANTVRNLRNAIERLQDEGAKGIILDLRFNPGGLFDAAVGVVSEFVDEGTALIWQEADDTERIYEVSGDGAAFDIPLVVITNGFTASAAEIVTGALQDHDRAVVIGTTTFGKGSVNVLTQIRSGAGLSITTARWLTPNGRVIEGSGLEPDIRVEGWFGGATEALDQIGGLSQSLCSAFEEHREGIHGHEELTTALENLCTLEGTSGEPPEGDEQLDVAVETLRRLLEERS